MIRYKLYQNRAKSTSTYGKWYARAVCEETIGIEKLADHMANHNTPYSKGCIYGVLRDLVSCVKELVLDGKNVKLDDLAIFSAGLQTKPASSPEDFTPVSNITAIKLRARATGTLRTPQLTTDAKVRQFSIYDGGQTESKTEGGTTKSSGDTDI